MAGDVKVAVVHGTVSTSATGTADFTKAGFGTPKVCIVLLSEVTSDTTVTDKSSTSMGFSDFSLNKGIYHQDEHGSAKVDCDSGKLSGHCYNLISAAGVSRTRGIASAIADGVRLTNIANVNAEAYLATVIMFGGADLKFSLDVVDTPNDITPPGDTVTVTTGIDQDLVFFIGVDVSAESVSGTTGINNSFGVAHIDTADHATFVNRCLGWASDHNNAVGSPANTLRNNRCLKMVTEAGTNDWGLELTAASTTSYTLTERDVSSGAGMEMYALALDLDDRKSKIGSVDSPTSGATWTPSVALGFTPQYVGLMLTGVVIENAINNNATEGPIGISSNTGAGNESCHSWYNEDAAATTNTASLFASNAIDFYNDDTATQVQDHSHSSFNSGDWTYTINTINDGTVRKWFYWAIEEAASIGQIVNMGLALETDTAFPVTIDPKRRLVTLASEADTAFVIVPVRTHPIGLASDTETAFVVVPLRTHVLGLALETDTAFPVAIDPKRRLVKQALETDTAFAFTHAKALAIGQALETDTAFAMAVELRRLVKQATETNTAFAIAVELRRLVTQAIETDTAFVITPSLGASIIIIGLATETDTGFPIVPLRTHVLGLAAETDTAFPIDFALRRLILQALETDTAFPMTHSKAVSIIQALETDIAFPMGHSIARAIGQAVETDTARPIVAVRLESILQALETDTAFPMTFDVRRLAALAVEIDTAFGMTPLLGGAPVGGGIHPRLRRRRRSC